MKAKDMVVLTAVVVGGYFLYKFLNKVSTAGNNALDAIAKPIADAYVELTSPAAPIPQGAVLMPDGSTFPAANLSSYNFGFVNGVAQFSVNGRIYALSPQVAGNYQATAVS